MSKNFRDEDIRFGAHAQEDKDRKESGEADEPCHGEQEQAEVHVVKREGLVALDLKNHGERISVTKTLHQNVLKIPLKTMVQPILPSQICPAKSLKLLLQYLRI